MPRVVATAPPTGEGPVVARERPGSPSICLTDSPKGSGTATEGGRMRLSLRALVLAMALVVVVPAGHRRCRAGRIATGPGDDPGVATGRLAAGPQGDPVGGGHRRSGGGHGSEPLPRPGHRSRCGRLGVLASGGFGPRVSCAPPPSLVPPTRSGTRNSSPTTSTARTTAWPPPSSSEGSPRPRGPGRTCWFRATWPPPRSSRRRSPRSRTTDRSRWPTRPASGGAPGGDHRDRRGG